MSLKRIQNNEYFCCENAVIPMKINLNNSETELNHKEISVKDLLAEKKFTFKMLIIKINGVIVKKDDYEITIIKDGDKVDVIHLISGG
jgi:sulfur carrier protein